MGIVRQCPSVACALLAAVLVVGGGTSFAASVNLGEALSGSSAASQNNEPSSSAAAVVGVVAHLRQVLLAPLQLPATIVRTSFEKNILYGVTIGAVRGVGRGVRDVAQGTVGAITAAFSGINPLGLGSSATSLLGSTR